MHDRHSRRSQIVTAYAAGACLTRQGHPADCALIMESGDADVVTDADLDAYTAAKGGVVALTRSFAAGMAPDGVRVNAICPGWVNTDMAWQGIDGFAEAIGGTREEAYAEAMKAVPLGRMSEPEDIAGTVRWLLSPDARGVTGQAIDQNGGAFML
jgi:NAD(P)-dependent dehydrogenase (short-subunit alcohol dehydrogenase family)